MMTPMGKRVRAAWSEPNKQSTDFKNWRRLFWENASDYVSSTSLHGYRYLTEEGLHWIERLMWVTVHVMAAWWVTQCILDVWRDYLNAPVFTTVHTTAYPVSMISFPAVAVCTNNRISRVRARRLAGQLAATRNVSEEELFVLMRYLGRLYDFNDRERSKMAALHALLTAGGHSYNVTRIMLQVTPPCKELLVRCWWQGQQQDCHKLFTMRRTMDGYCCTFNYVRAKDDFVTSPLEQLTTDVDNKHSDYDDEDDRIKRSRSPGISMGLSVVVNPHTDDYYYPLISSHGTKVMLFNPRDFPDTASGGLIEHLVPVGAEVQFRLQATSVYADSSVKDFSPRQRGCLFKSELSQLFAGSYSYSDCIMSCRVRSMATLCGCVPFYCPSLGTSRTCDMSDIGCLARYAGKWATLRPSSDVPGLEKEREVSISCEECQPACADTSYHVQATWSDLVQHRHQAALFPDGMENTTALSVFHMFFGSSSSTRLEKQVVYYWYDLMSNFGGICGLFVGLSLISVVEFIYFFTFRLFLLIRDCNGSKRKCKKLNSSHQGVIYWGEVMPSRHFNHI